MHLKSRKVKKVYQRHPDNDFAISVLPFMMVWPVVFPELGVDEGEGLQQE
jgi:nucleoside diphosphate kinase